MWVFTVLDILLFDVTGGKQKDNVCSMSRKASVFYKKCLYRLLDNVVRSIYAMLAYT